MGARLPPDRLEATIETLAGLRGAKGSHAVRFADLKVINPRAYKALVVGLEVEEEADALDTRLTASEGDVTSLKDSVSGLQGDVTSLQDATTADATLARLLDVDGAGSGLDADLLDGQQASAFQAAMTRKKELVTSSALSHPHTLAKTPINIEYLDVSIDGILVDQNKITLSGKDVSHTDGAWPTLTTITFLYWTTE
ncbi:UNVERIFIED_CONTAM: hypothetical protein BEN50_22395 [Euhalothece sp. KZN 001]